MNKLSRNVVVAAALGVTVATGAPPAHAASVDVTTSAAIRPQAPTTVTAETVATLKVKLPKLEHVDLLCFTFTFGEDLLDPGEEYQIFLGPDLGGFGAFNPGPSSLATRTTCLTGEHELGDFADGGNEKATFKLFGSGSVRLTGVTVRVTGEG